MFKKKGRSNYGLHTRRDKTWLTLTAIFVVFAVVLVSFFLIRRNNGSGNEREYLGRLWEEGAYDQVFELSKEALETRPLDYFLLTVNGFSAYQIGIAQINNFDTLGYIDSCILSLRRAILLKNAASDGRVYYVLGKAYCYKGDDYADLAIEYLERARALSYTAEDIPEYLGLSYAAIHDYRSSVEAFSHALNPASDVLLLSIARSYMALEEYDSARAYLLRCIEISQDSNTKIQAHLLISEILVKTGNSGGAELQYLSMMEEFGENAEAHYQLGELYAAGGDLTRARSEWRRAVQLDVSHTKARSRLAL
jgi:tetratricopeptide (TPR) repeat protein